MTTFTPEQIQQLQYARLTVAQTYYRLMSACLAFASPNPNTCEYLLHGFLRRLGTLQRCIQNVYSIYPPERFDMPARDETADLAINLQSFVFNVFGCIDNLAWVWATERQLTAELGGQLVPAEVSFQKRRLRRTLPTDFRTYLDGLRNWFEYMEGFRHALAHRIPLYIPPYTISPADEERHN